MRVKESSTTRLNGRLARRKSATSAMKPPEEPLPGVPEAPAGPTGAGACGACPGSGDGSSFAGGASLPPRRSGRTGVRGSPLAAAAKSDNTSRRGLMLFGVKEEPIGRPGMVVRIRASGMPAGASAGATTPASTTDSLVSATASASPPAATSDSSALATPANTQHIRATAKITARRRIVSPPRPPLSGRSPLGRAPNRSGSALTRKAAPEAKSVHLNCRITPFEQTEKTYRPRLIVHDSPCRSGEPVHLERPSRWQALRLFPSGRLIPSHEVGRISPALFPIAVNGALQTILERDLRLPAERLASTGYVGLPHLRV